MILRLSAPPIALLACLSVAAATGNARAAETQSITLTEKLQIPGAVLKPGDYTFSVEDRLQDRAIVRITSTDKNKHYLELSVPNSKLSSQTQNGLVLFQSKDEKKQALRGWMCPGCSSVLEFAYPKLEAVKITDESTEPVLAVDPEYDKLPANLSADDMRVVTLWLLSPERITADNKGEGVKAAKYSAAGKEQAPAETAQASQAPAPSEMASLAPRSADQEQPHRRLPKTASNTFSLAIWGLLLLLGAAGVRFTRRRRA